MGSLVSKIFMAMKLTYGPVHHGYKKVTSKGMDVEILVKLQTEAFKYFTLFFTLPILTSHIDEPDCNLPSLGIMVLYSALYPLIPSGC